MQGRVIRCDIHGAPSRWSSSPRRNGGGLVQESRAAGAHRQDPAVAAWLQPNSLRQIWGDSRRVSEAQPILRYSPFPSYCALSSPLGSGTGSQAPMKQLQRLQSMGVAPKSVSIVMVLDAPQCGHVTWRSSTDASVLMEFDLSRRCRRPAACRLVVIIDRQPCAKRASPSNAQRNC